MPGIEPVPGGKVKITPDENQKLTIYEIAIPRRELALFDPAAGRSGSDSSSIILNRWQVVP
jgi:hypothetical protein